MSDIAAAVSIGPSALYRHFRGKRELLYEVVLDSFAAVRAALPDGYPALAAAVLEHRGLGVLWQRESRHLEPPARAALRAEVVDMQRSVVARLRPASDLLGWAVLGAIMSVSFQRIRLPAPEYAALLASIADDIAATVLPPLHARPPAAPAPAALPTRDALLAAAVRLFASRGYHGTGIEEIGAAAGIAGPSVYHHFDSKLDILLAAMNHGAGELHAALAATVTTVPAPGAALRALLGSYVDYSFANSDTVDVLITEIDHLPDAQRTPLYREQRAYVAQWQRLMLALHPGMPPGHARVRVQAALTVTNDVARTPHLRTLAGIEDAVCAIGASILRI